MVPPMADRSRTRSQPDPIDGASSAPTFFPALVAESFDWLVSELGYTVAWGPPGHHGSSVNALYRSPKTNVRLYATLWHGCAIDIQIAPAGHPLTPKDSLDRRLAERGLAPPPTVATFRRRVQRSDLPPAEYQKAVRAAVEPYSDALRLLADRELRGDWFLDA